MENMTVLSRQMYDIALTLHNTADAARVLLEYKQYRTFADVLRRFSDCVDLKNRLVDGLLAWDPGSDRKSVERKVRNWLGGKNQSIPKKDAFVISRILNLSLERADEFLKMASGEGIHWRDSEEIVWSYAITQQLEPEKTRQLMNRAQSIQGKSGITRADSYTAVIFEKLQPLLYGSEEALLAFLEQEQENLGTFHNTAYRIFEHFMTLLEKGFKDGDIEAYFDELARKEKERMAAEKKKSIIGEQKKEPVMPPTEKISSRQVLETYLYRSLVPVKHRGSNAKSDPFAPVLRSIRQNWPDESTLSRMRSRELDVTRKVLILLFLATDGSDTEYAQEDEDEMLVSQDVIFEDVYMRLNLMLSSCGFGKLDPRNAFDWMILFCISSGDLWESDDRLRTMLAEMFQEENP